MMSVHVSGKWLSRVDGVRIAAWLFMISGTIAPVGVLGQTVPWNGPIDGNWSEAVKWTGGNVPDSNGETAVLGQSGSYQVLLNNSYQIGALQIPNPDAILAIGASRGLTVVSSVEVIGSVLLKATGSNSSTAFAFNRSLPGTLPLTGTGTIYLNAFSGNLDSAYLSTVNNTVVSIASTITVRGLGRIYGRYTNAGTIIADDPFGGALELYNITMQGAGTLRADGAKLQIQSPASTAQITGQSMIAVNGGSFLVHNGTTQFAGVNLNGPLTIWSNASLQENNGTVTGKITINTGGNLRVTSPGFTLNGDMVVNPSGTGTAGTYVNFNQVGTLFGSGTIALNCTVGYPDTAYIYTESNASTTIPAGRTIEGAGRMYGRYQLGGTIRANDSLLGRYLELYNVNLSNLGTGQIQAADALLQIRSPGTSVIAGVPMTATGSGSFLVHDGTTQFAGVNLNGPLTIWSNASLQENNGTVTGKITINTGGNLRVTSPDFTLNGDMVVNVSGSGNTGTYLYFGSTGTLLGSGTITLNANASNFDTAYITTESNAVVTFPATRAIAGSGRIYARMVHGGVLAPSNISLFSPIGRIELANTIALTPSASVEIDMASPTSFDQIAGNGARTLAGTLKLRLVNGFVARPSNSMAVIAGGGARTGTFGTIVPPPGYAAQSTYTPAGLTVSLSRTCPADLNSDGMVDDADFSIFVVAYNVLDCEDPAMPAWCPADINNDHLVDDADFSIFVGAYDILLCP